MTKESGSFLRAKFWHDRAEEAWSMASRMPDPEAKSTLVEIAERYDMLADSMAAKEAVLNRRETGHAWGSKAPVSPEPSSRTALALALRRLGATDPSFEPVDPTWRLTRLS